MVFGVWTLIFFFFFIILAQQEQQHRRILTTPFPSDFMNGQVGIVGKTLIAVRHRRNAHTQTETTKVQRIRQRTYGNNLSPVVINSKHGLLESLCNFANLFLHLSCFSTQ